MVVTLLVCPNCGGPLPEAASSSPFVRCLYCGSTSAVADGSLVERHHGDALAASEDAREQEARRSMLETEARVRAWQAVLEDLGERAEVPYPSFLDAVKRHLGAVGGGEVLARVAYKLALDFEHESKLPGRKAQVLTRLGQGYAEAVTALRGAPEAELNLPFLTAGPAGPVHYRRTVTAATIAALAEGDPAPPPKRGLLSRLFG